jgi:hypothetical protein
MIMITFGQLSFAAAAVAIATHVTTSSNAATLDKNFKACYGTVKATEHHGVVAKIVSADSVKPLYKIEVL